ncbi:DUF2264 domain-containing protein [Nonomuraea longicatena]|uniref:DUF2264 domain-containing protein n=1 Tax=Nonomuraea longicatena TaxID=83682 RepID=A0ABN1RA18_9ACTN
MQLPAEDRALSPYTGWGRPHWEAVADGLLRAVEPHRSADGATVLLPGRASVSRCDGLEGYARTFLLAAFRVAGGGPPALLTPYADGLDAGPRVWQPIRDRTQPMVEAASLAIGLWLTREHLWDTLPWPTRERVADYLADALHHEPVDNNWWLFPVMTGAFLDAAGLHTGPARAAVERGLARIEDWYAGGGWYSDGPNRSFDHYNGWAMHLYPVLLAQLSGREPGAYGARLRDFLTGYALTFDRDGGMLYHGRSLTYRFAAATSLFAGALAGVSPLPPGRTRGIASSVLRRFLDRGALSADGLLTLGWHGPHPASLQGYSGSASPYWAAKAFAGLLLPASHPVWTAPEEPASTGVAALAGPGFVVHNTGRVARVVNHGSQHHVGDPLYDRYAYSTRTGPTEAGDVPDNHIGPPGSGRGRIRPLGAGTLAAPGARAPGTGGAEAPDAPGALQAPVVRESPASAASSEVAWAASVAEETGVESLSVVRGAVEIRIHRTRPGTLLRQTGWALAAASPEPGAQGAAGARDADGLISRLTPLYGAAQQSPSVLVAEAGTAFGAPALVPALTGVTPTGWVVTAAVLDHAPAEALATADPGAATTDLRLPEAVVAADTVTLTWPDGLSHTFTAAGPL